MKRNTHQKQLVDGALQALRGEHPTAEQVYEHVTKSLPRISKATVYRILNQISQEGIIQRVEIPASADRYDDHLGPHYHMRCERCGHIADVDMPVMQDIYDRLPDEMKPMITGHDIVFTGLCAACKPEAES